MGRASFVLFFFAKRRNSWCRKMVFVVSHTANPKPSSFILNYSYCLLTAPPPPPRGWLSPTWRVGRRTSGWHWRWGSRPRSRQPQGWAGPLSGHRSPDPPPKLCLRSSAPNCVCGALYALCVASDNQGPAMLTFFNGSLVSELPSHVRAFILLSLFMNGK